jgi:hypothetical protein
MKKRLIAALIGIVLGVFLYGVADKRTNYIDSGSVNEYANVICWGTDVNTFEGDGLCADIIQTHCEYGCPLIGRLPSEYLAFDFSLRLGNIDRQFRVNFYKVIYPKEAK